MNKLEIHIYVCYNGKKIIINNSNKFKKKYSGYYSINFYYIDNINLGFVFNDISYKPEFHTYE